MKNTQQSTKHTLPKNLDLVITCSCNHKYIAPLVVFLKSLRTYNDIHVVCRLINCEPEDIQLVEKFDHITVIDERKRLSTVRNIRNPSEISINTFKGLRRRAAQSGFKGVGWLYSQEAAYCSNVKYNTINLLLNNNNKCIVYTDVDTIVRGDITSIANHVNSHDMGMYICPEEKEKDVTIYGDKYTGWHAGIIIANNTPLTRNFINVVESRVISDMYNMEADEDEFDYVYRTPEFRDLKIKSIDKMYKDSGPEFVSSSLMWSGQADNKESNQQYIAEYLKYEQTT